MIARFLLATGLMAAMPMTARANTGGPISIENRTIVVRPDAQFVHQLAIAPVRTTPGGERKLRTVGQMLAMVNTSGALTGPQRSWVYLDSTLIASLGIHLSDDSPAGFAYGVTSVSPNYRDQIHAGERVDIYRYGLRQNGTAGTVISVLPAETPDSSFSVVFGITHGQDWYPGVNCQIEFPLVHRQAFDISPLSMLHEGLHEYLLKEISAGHYQPIEITVVAETADHIYAIGDLRPGDRIVERGAILLKPLVRQILGQTSAAAAPVKGDHVR